MLCIFFALDLVQRALATLHFIFINTWNVLNLIQLIISRSFMCSTMSDHSKKEKKIRCPKNTVAFDIFEMLFNWIDSYTRADDYDGIRLGIKRINWHRCLSAKNSLHILTVRAICVFVCVWVSFLAMRLLISLFICWAIVSNLPRFFCDFFPICMQWRYWVKKMIFAWIP